MWSVEIPELYHLAVTLDLNLHRPVTEADVRKWVEGLMRQRVQEVATKVQELAVGLEAEAEARRGRFSYSFADPGPDEFDDDDELGYMDGESDDDEDEP